MSDYIEVPIDDTTYKVYPRDGAVFRICPGFGSSPPAIGQLEDVSNDMPQSQLVEKIRKLISC